MDQARPASGFRLVADAVVTVDDEGRVLRPGAVDVVGDRIGWVGPPSEAPPAPGPVTTVGGLLMPGLVNTHAHSPMTLLRSAGDGLPLDRWLHEVVWPREAAMGDEDVYWGMLSGAAEMLGNGITTTCEHYLHPRAVLAAVIESGQRAVVTPGIFEIPGAGPSGTWQHCLQQAGAVFDQFDGHEGRITIGFGPHAVYSVPEEGLRAVAAAAHQVGALVQTHVAETVAEGEVVQARYGCGAPEALARTGLLDGPLLAAHGVWLTEAEMELFARHRVAVAHCPASNGKLGSGVAPLAAMRRRGITVGLGTDSPASNDDLDLWEEMRLAPLMARSTACDPAALSSADALFLATRGGAEALGLDTGRLAAGCLADVIRLSMHDVRLTPAVSPAELVAHVVWAGAASLVTDVWVGGRQVVSEGHCLTVDAAIARGQVVRRAGRLFAADAG